MSSDTLVKPMSFSDYPVTRQLQRLADNPIDLTKEFKPERIDQFFAEAVGYKLFYGTERVTKEVMEHLFALAEERKVFEKMERLQAGEVVNFIEGFPSENRAALHTATRDLFDHKQTSKSAEGAANLAKDEIDRLEQFLPKLQSFEHLVVIGIGGSELGPKALAIALEAYYMKNRHVHFIGNVDPDDTVKILENLDLQKTAVCVISKSGTTLETTVNEAFARDIFEKNGIDSKAHFIAITGEGSPMDQTERYLASFHIWDWIGGRYSGTSIIGGLIIAYACGLNVYKEFLKGAHAMDQNALNKKASENLPLVSALLGVWNRNFLQIPTVAIIPYSHALWRFSAHLQQLDMESNGKQVDKQGKFVDFATGPVIWGEAGTNAQHSFFQSIHQGTSSIAIEFIGYKQNQTGKDYTYEGTTSQQKLNANLFAQAIALAVGQTNGNPNRVFFGNRPSSILFGEKLTPFALGALLAYYEHKVAFQGFLWNINSFDQEGVQLGKVLASKVIERFKNPEGEKDPLIDTFIKKIGDPTFRFKFNHLQKCA